MDIRKEGKNYGKDTFIWKLDMEAVLTGAF